MSPRRFNISLPVSGVKTPPIVVKLLRSIHTRLGLDSFEANGLLAMKVATLSPYKLTLIFVRYFCRTNDGKTGSSGWYGDYVKT